jgi:ABC-2 type transport system permease protein
MLLLSLPLAGVYIGGVAAVYPTASARAVIAASILASPAQRALYGNVYNDTLGAVGIWKAGMFHVLIAVAVILTVIRHTRAEEETGRGELIDSTVVGRYAGLTAALVLAFGASALTGLLAFAGLLTADIPATGSLAFAAALTGSGLVFSAVAAVTAQLSASARFARGAAFSALAVAFALRAVGDAGSTSGGVLSWLSPLGWSLLIRPYADERWWVLLLHIGAAATLTMIAYRLLARRDVGAGLIAERPGPASAVSWLRGPLGLTWRLDRASVLLWTTGLCIYGLLIGSVAHGVGDEIGDSGPAHDMVVRLGGTGALEQAFIAVSFTMLGMVAAAFAVSLTLRLHTEPCWPPA